MTSPNRHAFAHETRRYLVAGVLMLLPLWVTWFVLNLVFAQLSRMGRPWVQTLARAIEDSAPAIAGFLSHDWLESAFATVLTLVLLYLIGWATTQVLARRLIGWLESQLERIPLVQAIYGSTKKLLSALQTRPDGVQRVVLIEFPAPPLKTIGLVTRVLTDSSTGKQAAIVYVPTSPNPTSGYMEIVPLDRVIPTDWTLDEAMRFVVTGGTSAPDAIDLGGRIPRSTD